MVYVRAFDKKLKKYYKSFKYALINAGYFEQAILFNPHSNCFEIVDFLDKSTSDLKPLYEHIFFDDTEDLREFAGPELFALHKYCQERGYNCKLDFFSATKEIAENFEFIASILTSGYVCEDNTNVKVKKLVDNDWKYVQNQQAADELMDFYYEFHDSEIKNLYFQPQFNNFNALFVKFDNGNNEIELCFEGLTTLHLAPATEKYSNEIYCATLKVIDEKVFWFDNEVNEAQLSNLAYLNDITYIQALNLKWRIIK